MQHKDKRISILDYTLDEAIGLTFIVKITSISDVTFILCYSQDGQFVLMPCADGTVCSSGLCVAAPVTTDAPACDVNNSPLRCSRDVNPANRVLLQCDASVCLMGTHLLVRHYVFYIYKVKCEIYICVLQLLN